MGQEREARPEGYQPSCHRVAGPSSGFSILGNGGHVPLRVLFFPFLAHFGLQWRTALASFGPKRGASAGLEL